MRGTRRGMCCSGAWLTLQQSQIYLKEDNIGRAYMLLLRYSTLVLHHLCKHPEAKEAANRQLLRIAQGRMPGAMKQLEALKPEVNRAYDEWLNVHGPHRDEVAQPRSAQERFALRDPALSWNPAVQKDLLDAGQNQELAVDLASREITRRRRAAGLSLEEERRRRTAGVWEGWDNQIGANGETAEDELQAQMRAARQRLDGGQVHYGAPESSGNDQAKSSSGVPSYPHRASAPAYNYPTISKSSPFSYDADAGSKREPRGSLPPLPPPKHAVGQRSPPQVPPKRYLERELYDNTVDSRRSQPVRPLSSDGRRHGPSLPPKEAKDTKEAKVTFKPAAYLESGEPIRPIFLPNTLRRKFLEMAAPNTRRNLEMCGILCGTAVNNALFISCLLIPEQRCSPDTCETVNESAIAEFCLAQDLMMLGWIHTHPTQTCFMSSRDLHTHAGYQLMMPESIAIVCAPRHDPSYGFPLCSVSCVVT